MISTLSADMQQLLAADVDRYRTLVAQHVAGRAVDAAELKSVLAAIGRSWRQFEADCLTYRQRRDHLEAIAAADDARARLPDVQARHRKAKAALAALEAEYGPRIIAARREVDAAFDNEHSVSLTLAGAGEQQARQQLAQTADPAIAAQLAAATRARCDAEAKFTNAQTAGRLARNSAAAAKDDRRDAADAAVADAAAAEEQAKAVFEAAAAEEQRIAGLAIDPAGFRLS